MHQSDQAVGLASAERRIEPKPELTVSETLTSATLRRIVDDTPLGRGFSFQLPGRRVFIYEKDLRLGPDGMLLAMVA